MSIKFLCLEDEIAHLERERDEYEQFASDFIAKADQRQAKIKELRRQQAERDARRVDEREVRQWAAGPIRIGEAW